MLAFALSSMNVAPGSGSLLCEISDLTCASVPSIATARHISSATELIYVPAATKTSTASAGSHVEMLSARIGPVSEPLIGTFVRSGSG